MMRKVVTYVFKTDAEAADMIRRTRAALFEEGVYRGGKLRRRDDFLSALHEALPTMCGLDTRWDYNDVRVVDQALRDVSTSYMKRIMLSTDSVERERCAAVVNECHALMPLWEPEP